MRLAPIPDRSASRSTHRARIAHKSRVVNNSTYDVPLISTDGGAAGRAGTEATALPPFRYVGVCLYITSNFLDVRMYIETVQLVHVAATAVTVVGPRQIRLYKTLLVYFMSYVDAWRSANLLTEERPMSPSQRQLDLQTRTRNHPQWS